MRAVAGDRSVFSRCARAMVSKSGSSNGVRLIPGGNDVDSAMVRDTIVSAAPVATRLSAVSTCSAPIAGAFLRPFSRAAAGGCARGGGVLSWFFEGGALEELRVGGIFPAGVRVVEYELGTREFLDRERSCLW